MRTGVARALSLLLFLAVALGTQAGLCDVLSLFGIDPHPAIECADDHVCDSTRHEHGSRPCSEQCESDVEVMAQPRLHSEIAPAAVAYQFDFNFSDFLTRWDSAPRTTTFQEPPDLPSFLCSPAVTCRVLI